MPCLKLRLDGPTDALAEARLVRAIEAEPGVLGVVFCHDRRGLEIDFEDDEVTIDRLIAIAREEHFDATLGG
jgi:hypothetical protein